MYSWGSLYGYDRSESNRSDCQSLCLMTEKLNTEIYEFDVQLKMIRDRKYFCFVGLVHLAGIGVCDLKLNTVKLLTSSKFDVLLFTGSGCFRTDWEFGRLVYMG